MKTLLISLAVLLAAGATAALVFGRRRWQAATARLDTALEAARVPIETKVFSGAELEDLPAPVQRFFRTALVEGLRIVADVAIKQTGTFNQNETTPAWKRFTAVQHVTTHRPGYYWDAHIRSWPGVSVRVRDAYVAGEGILQASVFGLFPVADLRDSGELAKGELMRYLAEAAWYPTALLPSQGVRWAAVDDHSARATLGDGAITVTLLFRFNAANLIDSFRADARGRRVGEKTDAMPWEGRFWDYAVRSGMCVPQEGEVSWMHPEGPKPYWRGLVTRFDYKFAR